jgi:PadR family transcriptional regulator PadR
MSAPMREPTFWILTALAPEPRHGYGVVQEVARLPTSDLTLQVAAHRRFGLGPVTP